MIAFTVVGEPVAKGRPKFRIVWERDLVVTIFRLVKSGAAISVIADTLKNGLTTMAYTPAKTFASEEEFAWRAAKFKPTKPMDGPLRVDTIFVVQAPKKFPPDRSHEWPHVPPDDDNYRKLALDAMKQLFWHNDAQVCGGESYKIYGSPARTWVRIRQLTIEDASAVRVMIGEAEPQGRLI